MPGRNGTGPMGQRLGRGRGGGDPLRGGNCVCPNCGEVIPHQRGTPCNTVICPKCSKKMVRE